MSLGAISPRARVVIVVIVAAVTVAFTGRSGAAQEPERSSEGDADRRPDGISTDGDSGSREAGSATRRLAREVADRALAVVDGARGEVIVSIRRGGSEPGELSPLLAELTEPTVERLRSVPGMAVHVEIRPAGLEAYDVRRAAFRGFEHLLAFDCERDGWSFGCELRRFDLPGGFAALGLTAQDRIPSTRAERNIVAVDAPLSARLDIGAPLRRESIRAKRLALGERHVVLCAGSDVDGSRGLLVAGRKGVRLLRLSSDEAHLVTVAEGRWPLVTPPLDRPRRTVSSLGATGSSTVLRTSDLPEALTVHRDGRTLELRAAARMCAEGAYPLDDACAVRSRGRDWFVSTLLARRDAADDAPAPLAAPAPFYARRLRTVRRRDGSVARTESVVTPNGRLVVRTGERTTGVTGYGAALAMADADVDGRVEMLVASPNAVGEGDRLELLRVRESGAIVSVWSSTPLAGSVLLAAAADVDGDGLEELMAVEEPAPGEDGEAHLWIVR